MSKSQRFVCFVTLFALVFSVFSFNLHKAYASTSVSRLSGSDRYGTAVSISQHGWEESRNVVLATGEDFPDALCAAPLAVQLNAPILLTGKLLLRDDVYSEIKRLGVKNAYIVGGPGVISSSIDKRLSDDGISIVRLYGSDRYETSLKVGNYIADNLENSIPGVMIATGENFPDALSAAPAAAVQGMPVLLSSRDSIPEGVLEFIKNRNVGKEFIIGGTGAVSSTAESQLSNAERIWGSDRYETNAQVLFRFKDVLNFSKVYLSTGEDFPDALAGSALAPKSASPVVLTSISPSSPTVDFINSEYSSIDVMCSLGGTGVVPGSTVESLLSSNINTEGNSLSNLSNFGTAAVQGGYIYYSNYSDSQSLYRMKSDGTSPVKLGDVEGVNQINVLGSWIYYSSEEGRLCRITTQGTDNSILVDDEVYFIYASQDWIYFYSGGALWRMKPDGSARIKIVETDDMHDYYIGEGYVYYLDNGNLERIGTSGTGKAAELYGDIQHFSISNGYIYFVSGNQKLYRSGMNGTGTKLLTDDSIGGFNAKGSWIYYINSSDNNNIYKISVEGTSRTKLADEPVSGDINIVGDNIFCSSIDAGYSINRMGSDGQNAVKISDGAGYSLRFSDDWIYYVNISDSDHVSRMKTDGSEKKDYNVSSSSKIVIYNGVVYYSNEYDNGKIYSIGEDGTGNQKVTDIPAGEFTISRDSIYYSNMSDGNKLYKINIDGSGNIKLSDNSAMDIIADGEWVYYFDEGIMISSADGEEVPSNYGIYRVAADGASPPVMLSPVYIDSMSITNGSLLYHCMDTEGNDTLYSSNLEGQDSIKIADNTADFTADDISIYKLDKVNQYKITQYSYDGSVIRSFDIPEPGYYITSSSGWLYYETFTTALNFRTVSIWGQFTHI